VRAELDRAFANGTSAYGLEVINRHKAGHLYHARLSVTALHDADGSLLGFTVAHRDITRLKELEHLKSQFTSRIGHELRTPLTNLIIYLDLLEHGKAERREKYLATLNREADRLRRLIEGFLRISELDALTAPPQLIALSLNEIVAGLLLKQRGVAASRQVELEPQLDPTLPRVLAEPSLLAEAIERLLDNAVNYTPNGGHIAVASTVVTIDQQRRVVLKIADSGPGFSPADQLHLFERFYRGEAARDYATPGAGLSLSICQTIVKLLGGSLTVENEAGQGAVITLWLTVAA
jgi:two-component system phosphate regulon sensor histidine kinase PhoR